MPYPLTNTRIVVIICMVIIVCVVLNSYRSKFPDQSASLLFARVAQKDEPVSKTDINFSQNFIRERLKDMDQSLADHWVRVIKEYIPLPLESGYGSHKPALLAAALLTPGQGPVMEMGCGFHSTVLLHRMVVVEQQRYLFSTDTDEEWLSKFKTNLTSANHQFRHIKRTKEWDQTGIDRPRWSFIFIDHKPGERRVVDLIRLANRSDIIILHDTETSSYNYEAGLVKYPYRYRYTYLGTHTDVVSLSNETLFRSIKKLLELTIELKLPK